MRVIETKYILLPIIDRMWVDHLYVMDALKTGIGLRGYGQKDPRVEYEKEAYEIFEDLKSNIADEAIKSVFRVVVEQQPQDGQGGALAGPVAFGSGAPNGAGSTPLPEGSLAPNDGSRVDPAYAEKLLGPVPGAGEKKRDLHTNRGDEEPRKPVRSNAKVGRNELCPCGSGKKYKRCHGAAA
jgi:preprotein translocase subunit SecA